MSFPPLSRFVAPEFRPLFRTFEEPFGRPSFSAFHHPLFNDQLQALRAGGISPAVDVTESENGYVVYAELPGVRKENVNVSLGDAGRSLTISGRVVHKPEEAPADAAPSAEKSTGMSTNVTKKDDGHKLYNERTFVHDSSFSRTLQLPYPVDPEKVFAKMDHGILTITLGKLEDKATTKTIAIE